METGLIIGYDPGGNRAHGLAELRVQNGKVIGLSTRTLRTTEEVLSVLYGVSSLLALGVDSLTCWSTGRSGWRPADRWLRKHYPEVKNSVVSPNSLFGSMGLNGMAVLVAARQRFRDLHITETHPKVLYWQMERAKYNYAGSRKAMNGVLAAQLGTAVKSETEHEWDAAVSALAAFKSVEGQWPHDLHRRVTDKHERLIEPCGTTHYSWPE